MITIILDDGCRKTLQYGYDSQQGIDRWMGQKLNGLDPWTHTREQQEEVRADSDACGFLPPHYPVPALYDPERLSFWELVEVGYTLAWCYDERLKDLYNNQ